MRRYYVRIDRGRDDWTCAIVLARNEQFAVWAAFEKLSLRSANGWIATQVTCL